MSEWSLVCHDSSKLPENTIFFVVLPLNKIHDVIVCNDVFYFIFAKNNLKPVNDITVVEFVLMILELFDYPSSPNGSIFVRLEKCPSL